MIHKLVVSKPNCNILNNLSKVKKNQIINFLPRSKQSRRMKCSKRIPSQAKLRTSNLIHRQNFMKHKV